MGRGKEKKKRRAKRKSKGSTRKPKREEIHVDELKGILERSKAGALSEDEHGKLEAAVDTLVVVTRELETKGTSIRRLRKLIFGSSTEKTRFVLGEDDKKKTSTPGGPGEPEPDPSDGQDGDGAGKDAEKGASTKGPGDSADSNNGKKGKKKPKGHGRNGASAYTGAKRKSVPHPALRHHGPCPECPGKLYRQKEPAKLLRLRGVAPLEGTIYELERLRCGTCGKVFTATPPPGVGEKKYDDSVAALIALLKYGYGFPFHRLDQLQANLGIPLPSSNQWELVDAATAKLRAAYEELLRQAAQGEVVHNDDTTMKILDIDPMVTKDDKERNGVYTTGIVSVGEGRRIALFFTGHQHAEENLADVLKRRAEEHEPPIQMCDGLSHNTAGEFESIVANCIPHSRRKFVDIVDNFPEECRVVLNALRMVYRFESKAKEQKLSPDERLHFHQQHSGPVMEELKEWLQKQFDEKRVEPNSGLGDAIRYMQRHWEKLTLFLRVASAPLDNNIVERALKKAILNRKNAYFYKTEKGAAVGDLFMSFIHTCELAKVNAFDYLFALLQHHEQAATDPAAWMPWNFKATLEQVSPEHAPTHRSAPSGRASPSRASLE